MATKQPHKPYVGVLDQPLEAMKVGLLMDDAERAIALREYKEQEATKMVALLDHYEIPSSALNPWYELALILARQLVPGLQEARRRGPPTKWGDLQLAFLWVEVEALMDRDKSGIDAAVKSLAGREPWKSFLSEKDMGRGGSDPAEALRRAYHNASGNVWINVARKSRLYELSIGGEEAWQKTLAETFPRSRK